MYLLGYSLNNLSLMALTIATGFVVDDAIVMIENIARYIEEGEPPLQAALKGATQIGFTIISLTVSLIAVLIPLLFMGDVVGRLFREFAVTLAITILISAVVSLTLVPMMSARWLKRAEKKRSGLGAQRAALLRPRDRSATTTALGWVLDHQRHHAAGRAGSRFALTVLLYVVIPKGLFPTQDTGQLQAPRRGGAGRLVRPHGRSCSSRRRGRSCRIRTSTTSAPSSASTRANNTMLHTGSMLINLQHASRRPAGR